MDAVVESKIKSALAEGRSNKCMRVLLARNLLLCKHVLAEVKRESRGEEMVTKPLPTGCREEGGGAADKMVVYVG